MMQNVNVCLRENVTKNVTKKSDRWDFLENFWNIYTNPQEREYCYFYFISIGYRINRMMLKKWMDIRLSPTAHPIPSLRHQSFPALVVWKIIRFLYQILSSKGQIAQSVEQRTENPCVGGSIPPLATTYQLIISIFKSCRSKSHIFLFFSSPTVSPTCFICFRLFI